MLYSNPQVDCSHSPHSLALRAAPSRQVGLCGVLTILFAIVIAVGVSHSLFGVRMDHIFDELPFLFLFLGVQGVFSLLDARCRANIFKKYFKKVKIFTNTFI